MTTEANHSKYKLSGEIGFLSTSKQANKDLTSHILSCLAV